MDSPAEGLPITPAEANRRHYAVLASTYDGIEDCYANPRCQAFMRDRVARALALVPSPSRVLDACGGTGNLSLALLERGLQPLTLDISPEMLARFESKARSSGYLPRTECDEVLGFLAHDEREWDAILFSSALHHLEDPAAALRAAAARLAPGGVIVSLFDPKPVGPVGVALRLADWLLYLLRHNPREFVAVASRRIRTGLRSASLEQTVGRVAELHAMSGLDDGELSRELQRAGLRIVVREARYDARLAMVRAALRLLRIASSFHLVAQAPSSAGR